MKFTEQQEHTLLNVAEWSIQKYLETGKREKVPELLKNDPDLQEKLGVFVSVYIKDKLRGCIGTFSESAPLIENVKQMAIQAASEDSRFAPLKPKEIQDLGVEISVLSKRRRIYSPEDIQIGKHGVYLVHEIRRATLLPQVAVNNNFSPVEFLECCAKNKLGLQPDSWKEADIYVYEAVIIT